MEFDQLTIVGLGDIVEGCEGFYDMQTFTVEYDLRRQKMIARRLLVKFQLVHFLSKLNHCSQFDFYNLKNLFFDCLSSNNDEKFPLIVK